MYCKSAAVMPLTSALACICSINLSVGFNVLPALLRDAGGIDALPLALVSLVFVLSSMASSSLCSVSFVSSSAASSTVSSSLSLSCAISSRCSANLTLLVRRLLVKFVGGSSSSSVSLSLFSFSSSEELSLPCAFFSYIILFIQMTSLVVTVFLVSGLYIHSCLILYSQHIPQTSLQFLGYRLCRFCPLLLRHIRQFFSCVSSALAFLRTCAHLSWLLCHLSLLFAIHQVVLLIELHGSLIDLSLFLVRLLCLTLPSLILRGKGMPPQLGGCVVAFLCSYIQSRQVATFASVHSLFSFVT
mmetsp:Transcript_7775/g.15877  ORF Transcript_7775/g.15877 Transcript_7775/m.15877 type:complete len:300 (-) Transcript_7775:1575-2474(-)